MPCFIIKQNRIFRNISAIIAFILHFCIMFYNFLMILIAITCDNFVALIGATYDDFVDALKEAEDKRECRYGVFDVEYQLADGSQRSKLVFYLW